MLHHRYSTVDNDINIARETT